jgi:hypothetical protein
MIDVLKRLEDSIDSARPKRGQPSHEVLNMHKVFAVIDECHRLRALELHGNTDGHE